MNVKSLSRGALAAGVALAVMMGMPAAGSAADKLTINVQPVSKLKQGGTFTWTISTYPVNYNTSHIDGNALDTNNVVGPLLPSMWKVDYNGKLVVDKDYAVSVTLTKKSPQTVVYRINPKAKWSDGKAITWKDFELNWKANNGSNKEFAVNSTGGYDSIGSVKRGKTDLEVVVVFSKPYADWQALFNGLLPQNVVANPQAFATAWKDRPTVSAGPFQFQSKDDTAKTVTLSRNPKWWGDKPVLDRIVFRTVLPDAQIDALANGEVDFADIGADINKFKRVQTLKGVRVDVNNAPQYRHVDLGKSGPLADRRVRQAVHMAIDRNTIAKAMVGVINPSTKPLNNHIFVQGVYGYKDASGIYGKYNLQRADALLEAAGWTGNPRKNAAGEELKLTFVIPTGVATSAQESQLIQTMLKAIGITVELKSVPVSDFLDDLEKCPGDLTVFTWVGGLFPIASSQSIYSLPKAGTEAGQNFCGIGSATIDKLLEQANSELDPEKRVTLANRAASLIWQEGHSVLLYQRPNVVATDSKVANFGAFGFGGVDYTKIGFTK